MKNLIAILLLFFTINLMAQFPDIKGKAASGLIPMSATTKNIVGYGIKYELVKEKIEFSHNDIKTYSVVNNNPFICPTGIEDNQYSHYIGLSDTVVQNSFQFGVGLKDFVFKVLDEKFKPEYKVSYVFSKSIDKTIILTCKEVEQKMKYLRSKVETKLKKSNNYILANNKSQKELITKALKAEMDKITSSIHTYSISPILSIKHNDYAKPTKDTSFIKASTPSIDFGINASYSWLKKDFGYGALQGFSVGGYFGYRSNSISELKKKEYCQISNGVSTLDKKNVVIQTCSELLSGNPDETFEAILKVDFSRRIFTPKPHNGPAFKQSTLFFLTRLQGTWYSKRGDKVDSFIGLSLARSDQQILGVIFFKLSDLFRSRSESDIVETPILEATLGIPIGN